MSDPHDNWRRRLDGTFLPVGETAECGCYRIRRGQTYVPARIWEHVDQETGEVTLAASCDGKLCRPEQIWPACAKDPVTAAAYRYFSDHGRWPSELEPMPEAGHNLAAAPEHEKIAAQAQQLQADSIAWFESIGSAIKTRIQADRAQAFAAAFERLGTTATLALKDVCRAAKEEISGHERQWKPSITLAEDARLTIKREWLQPYLLAARQQAAEANLPKYERPAVISAGGAARRPSLTMIPKPKIVDRKAFGTWLAELEDPPSQYLAVLQKVANSLVWRQKLFNLPGLEVHEVPEIR
jgi:hypothetical protein